MGRGQRAIARKRYNGKEMSAKHNPESAPAYHLPFDINELGRKGEELYERELRDRLEPNHVGEFVVMNVETGEYELDADRLAAGQRAMARFPAHTRYMKRVGYDAAGSIGGPMRRTAR